MTTEHGMHGHAGPEPRGVLERILRFAIAHRWLMLALTLVLIAVGVWSFGKLPIDTINGGPSLREWVDDAEAEAGDLDAIATPDEQAWEGMRRAHLIY